MVNNPGLLQQIVAITYCALYLRCPDRLGHVIHVNDQFRKAIERQHIGLELCLSCNVHARLITGSFSDHHFGMWRHSKSPVILCVSVTLLADISDDTRRMMLECSAVLYPKNTTSQQVISI